MKGKQDLRYKIVIIGDRNTGKTHFANQLAYALFEDDIPSTIGYSYKTKEINIDDKSNIILQFWENPSIMSEIFSVIRSFIRGARGIFVFYDITNRKSFDNISRWIECINAKVPITSDMCLLIIGNKCDLESSRVVKTEEGEAISRRFGAHFQEVSTKYSFKINEALNIMVNEMLLQDRCGCTK